MKIWSATLGESSRELLVDAGFEPLRGRPSELELHAAALFRPTPGAVHASERILRGHGVFDIGNWDFRMIDSEAG